MCCTLTSCRTPFTSQRTKLREPIRCDSPLYRRRSSTSSRLRSSPLPSKDASGTSISTGLSSDIMLLLLCFRTPALSRGDLFVFLSFHVSDVHRVQQFCTSLCLITRGAFRAKPKPLQVRRSRRPAAAPRPAARATGRRGGPSCPPRLLQRLYLPGRFHSFCVCPRFT